MLLEAGEYPPSKVVWKAGYLMHIGVGLPEDIIVIGTGQDMASVTIH